MLRKITHILLALLFVADIGYSFVQYYNTPLDGDMAAGIVPAPDVAPLLTRPFGIEVFTESDAYPNPNRFFCHWLFYHYFNNVPQSFQGWMSPIDSVYFSCALAKVLIHLGLIFILVFALTGSGKAWKRNWIMGAVLVTALFQANGYRSYMGVIDSSTTYTFFYAFPCILLLLYFMPLILKFKHGHEFRFVWTIRILWIPLAVVTALSGPLNTGIALVLSLLLMVHLLFKFYNSTPHGSAVNRLANALKSIPFDYYFFLIPICLLSLYSLYIGQFGVIEMRNKMPLGELYARLPAGLWSLLTGKPGFIFLFLALILNAIVIRVQCRNQEGKTLLRLFKWIGFFAVLYILLLPFGGFRIYRPEVIRYDTFLPVTLSLIYIFAATSVFLINHIAVKHRYWYIPVVVLVAAVFFNADRPKFDQDDCERKKLRTIAASPEKVVSLSSDCEVVSWDIITRPEDSEMIGRLLLRWNITDDKKQFVQPTVK